MGILSLKNYSYIYYLLKKVSLNELVILSALVNNSLEIFLKPRLDRLYSPLIVNVSFTEEQYIITITLNKQTKKIFNLVIYLI
jgi:hypothetical protein